MAFDEPFAAAKRDGTLEDWRQAFFDWCEWVRESAGYTDLILIEPYPSFDLDDWKNMIIPAAADGACGAAHIDVDHPARG